MKTILQLVCVTLFTLLLTSSNVPDTWYQKEGDHYVQYSMAIVGGVVQPRATGTCALSSSGTMSYPCGMQ
jgi:hypothetical protein